MSGRASGARVTVGAQRADVNAFVLDDKRPLPSGPWPLGSPGPRPGLRFLEHVTLWNNHGREEYVWGMLGIVVIVLESRFQIPTSTVSSGITYGCAVSSGTTYGCAVSSGATYTLAVGNRNA